MQDNYYNDSMNFVQKFYPDFAPANQAEQLCMEGKYEEAVPLFKEYAEQGDARAQKNLGYCYEKGIGTSKNEQEAFRWYMKSAEQEYLPAINRIGTCFKDGIGTDFNEQEAINCFTKAATQGFAPAQCNLGMCYKDGKGTEKNPKESFKWFMEAASQGNPVAQARLAQAYANGIGINYNQPEAEKWIRKAMEKGVDLALIISGAGKTKIVLGYIAGAILLLGAIGCFIDGEWFYGILCILGALGAGFGTHANNSFDVGIQDDPDGEGDPLWFKYYFQKNNDAAIDAWAIFEAGNSYRLGKGTDIDYKKALKKFQESDTGVGHFYAAMVSREMGKDITAKLELKNAKHGGYPRASIYEREWYK